MKPQTRRITYSLALLVWSGVLLYFYASGRVNHYLVTDFRPLALAGGLGLAVLGLFNFLTLGRQTDCGHDHGAGEEAQDHESGDMHPLTAFLLIVVPVGLSVAWTKDEYSIAALSRKGLYDTPRNIVSPFPGSSGAAPTLQEIENNHRRTPDGFLDFNLMELYFANGDRQLQSIIEGLKVQTVGRWTDEKVRNPNGTRKRLYRLFLTCCAADSRAIPIILEFPGTAPEFPENSWVKVSGTMRFPLEDGELQPVLTVDHTLATDAPPEENFMRK